MEEKENPAAQWCLQAGFPCVLGKFPGAAGRAATRSALLQLEGDTALQSVRTAGAFICLSIALNKQCGKQRGISCHREEGAVVWKTHTKKKKKCRENEGVILVVLVLPAWENCSAIWFLGNVWCWTFLIPLYSAQKIFQIVLASCVFYSSTVGKCFTYTGQGL